MQSILQQDLLRQEGPTTLLPPYHHNMAKHYCTRRTTSSSDPVLLPRYSSRLFRSSFITCFSVIGALCTGLWGCAFVAFVVLLTSLNYWRDPVTGWRRSADMTSVIGAATYHIYYCAVVCHKPLVQVLYVLVVANSGYCYLQARKARDQNVSSAWHCGLHLLSNAANVLLYLGVSM